ncbi:MAG: 4Fe-4S cluster-binding domain-containing protein [Bacteroidales bacterium]|nr:4Fe-4S cluster-binding domain-containing protein [Bacteroidales bacterium]
MNLLSSRNCLFCPRQCAVDRSLSQTGYCNCNNEPLVSNIFLHKGEEPVISGRKGICNVFFSHCNLQCIYCQNYQISINDAHEKSWLTDTDMIVNKISEQLDRGVKLLGFVSPSHQVGAMVRIIENVWNRGYRPIIVYNSNGYDNVEILKELDGIVDVYLPDFKYFDNKLGQKYSNVNNYFEVASKAVREMYRQKGSTIILDDDGLIESGVIVRHLVLPGCESDSINVLEYISNEITPFLHISLMAQYFPTEKSKSDSLLNRKLKKWEYDIVIQKMEEIGFDGWIQELESSDYYKPDFLCNTPFKDNINN